MLQYLREEEFPTSKPESRILWNGKLISCQQFVQSKKGNTRDMTSLMLASRSAQIEISLPALQGLWLAKKLIELESSTLGWITYQRLKEDYEQLGLDDFELFIDNKPVSGLHKVGWWRV
jgi:hypothetical protein